MATKDRRPTMIEKLTNWRQERTRRKVEARNKKDLIKAQRDLEDKKRTLERLEQEHRKIQREHEDLTDYKTKSIIKIKELVRSLDFDPENPDGFSKSVQGVQNDLRDLSGIKQHKYRKDLLYKERYHYETLIKDRLTLQLVFASLFLYSVYRGPENFHLFLVIDLYDILLIGGFVISITLTLAVMRTSFFANLTLEQIEKDYLNDPYTILNNRIKGITINVNNLLRFASIIATITLGIIMVTELSNVFEPYSTPEVGEASTEDSKDTDAGEQKGVKQSSAQGAQQDVDPNLQERASDK